MNKVRRYLPVETVVSSLWRSRGTWKLWNLVLHSASQIWLHWLWNSYPDSIQHRACSMRLLARHVSFPLTLAEFWYVQKFSSSLDPFRFRLLSWESIWSHHQAPSPSNIGKVSVRYQFTIRYLALAFNRSDPQYFLSLISTSSIEP